MSIFILPGDVTGMHTDDSGTWTSYDGKKTFVPALHLPSVPARGLSFSRDQILNCLSSKLLTIVVGWLHNVPAT